MQVSVSNVRMNNSLLNVKEELLIYYNSKRSVVNLKNASLSAMFQKGITNKLEMLRDA